MKWLYDYKRLNKAILYLILAIFCEQIVNAIQTLALNLYLKELGYTDPQIANLTSYRFVAALIFAVPFGLYIKSKSLRPVFITALAALPMFAVLIIWAASLKIGWLLSLFLVGWGISQSAIGIATGPYILRNTPIEQHTLALSMNSATWSSSFVLTGLLTWLLMQISPQFFTNYTILMLFSVLGFSGLFWALRLPKNENIAEKRTKNIKRREYYQYDWPLIIRTSIPNLLIAIGGGLAVPFMNLFFANIFGVTTAQFSLLSAITCVLVALGLLYVPTIKLKYGYNAITYTQILAIFLLALLAFSDFYSAYWWALPLAVLSYMLRQPLMNIANPMTSEVSMYYVGDKNREMMSAIHSSIWSGSWFISSQLFRMMRQHELRYGTIILITVGLYIVGAYGFHLLIQKYKNKTKTKTLLLQAEPQQQS
ncbi:MAG: MFS transporter [Sphingobacteriales bacterium]|jgi:MFS family permease|nr:MFS transporter [Sphingobacteriales bacterium]MBP9141810.1 MFS transporter [Chitinophagales bacterium]MDA0198186.1 MFS transporter [Bacteroidota bacterium]MBK6889511.1 MFS transporter [Sphingobacteriales bacterium]MBK7527986.1 MFS transporter [Sphingobacteriales bacterium]